MNGRRSPESEPDSVAGLATLWALNLGFWPLLALTALVDGPAWLLAELARDFEPARKWLWAEP